MDDLVAPDVRFNDDAIRRDGLKQYAAALRSAFPGMQIDIEDLIAEDDTAAFRYTWRGTNTGALVARPVLPYHQVMRASSLAEVLDKTGCPNVHASGSGPPGLARRQSQIHADTREHDSPMHLIREGLQSLRLLPNRHSDHSRSGEGCGSIDASGSSEASCGAG